LLKIYFLRTRFEFGFRSPGERYKILCQFNAGENGPTGQAKGSDSVFGLVNEALNLAMILYSERLFLFVSFFFS
jgi:hypothetical protein